MRPAGPATGGSPVQSRPSVARKPLPPPPPPPLPTPAPVRRAKFGIVFKAIAVLVLAGFSVALGAAFALPGRAKKTADACPIVAAMTDEEPAKDDPAPSPAETPAPSPSEE